MPGTVMRSAPDSGWLTPAISSAAGPNTGTGCRGQQFRDAADMVAMVVGGEDGTKPVAALRQMLQHRRGVARVDHRDLAVGAQQPDIVVVEGGQGTYFSH
jgi:hypothetical protein